jgi:transposase
MTSQATQYLALDVHQATVVASLRSADGSIRMRATVPTEAKAVINLVRGAGPHVRVALEEGTQAQWLHDLIAPIAETVIVCSMRGRSDVEQKSDQIDADRLSELLRLGALKAVFHGGYDTLTLKELVRNYLTLVDDATRTKLRIKALFRARGIQTPGRSVFRADQRRFWLEQLHSPGARLRAEHLLTELDTMTALRRRAKIAMVSEAQQRSGWNVLRSIPVLGPVRISCILAIIVTPHRFRTKRQLWPYCGLAVVTRSSGEQQFVDGVLKRRRHVVATRGLNRNYNRVLKNVFKGAAAAALIKSGPLKELHDSCVERGMRRELATLTLARKIAAVTLRLWKKGELWDPKKLTMQAT